MSRHGEKIRKRSDGRWEGRYKIGNYENGNTRYASVYGRTYAEVKEKLNEKILKAMVGDETVTPLFQDVAMEWMKVNHQKNKGSTEAKYDFLISKHIVPDLGNYMIGSLTTAQLNLFCEHKLSGDNEHSPLSASYVRSIMLIVSSIMDYAVSEKICPQLNTAIFKPSVERKDIRILQKPEQIALERCLRSNIDPTKLGILLTLYTGMRIGEICALKWEDIDFSNEIINVRSTVSRINCSDNTKKSTLVIDSPKTTASKREIPIPSGIMNLIQSVRAESKSKYVVSAKEDFLSPRTYEYRFHKILQSCAIPQINYHALRHTFATRCVEVGVDIKTLSELLGHASVAITLNTYVHPSMELKRSQINKLSCCLES